MYFYWLYDLSENKLKGQVVLLNKQYQAMTVYYILFVTLLGINKTALKPSGKRFSTLTLLNKYNSENTEQKQLCFYTSCITFMICVGSMVSLL
jgi:hypothetical protein